MFTSIKKTTQSFVVSVGLLFAGCVSAFAGALTSELEVHLVPNVGASWVTVPLVNTYSNPVVVCTYNLPSKNDPSATTRIQAVTSSSFQVRIQQFENSNTVTPSGVHCIISEEGAYNLPNGLKYEARTVLSDGTSGQYVTGAWGGANTEEVTNALTQSYSNPVVLGQVMSFNDVKASVFWTNNCVNTNRRPFESYARMCVGKHIGQINGTRVNETIGYIVAESGSGTLNGMDYELALGADSVAGTLNNSPYNYTVSDDYEIGVISQNGMDGGHGGWAVLFGTDPLLPNTIGSAIEEEVFAGDKTRTHTTEHVSYWVFKETQTALLNAQKTVAMANTGANSYAIPGTDVLYTIQVENTGSGAADADSIFIADQIPPDTTYYFGDIDGPAGPEIGAVIFASTGSGLTFNEPTDLGFSKSATKPTSFADCTDIPAAGYDPTIRYICFNPKGSFGGGSFGASEFSVTFRAMIK